MSRLTRDGTAEPVSRDKIIVRREQRGQENNNFPCSADHDVQDWPPYPVDPYSCYMCNHKYIHEGAPIARRLFLFMFLFCLFGEDVAFSEYFVHCHFTQYVVRSFLPNGVFSTRYLFCDHGLDFLHY